MIKKTNLRTMEIGNKTVVINDEDHIAFSFPTNRFRDFDFDKLEQISNRIKYNNSAAKTNDFLAGLISIRTVYLMMTNRCNFRCNFCSFGCDKENSIDGKSSDFSMDYTKIKELLQRIKPQKIIFTGGEPLLNQEIIRYMKIAKKYTNSKVILQTNGYYLNKISREIFTLIDWIEISTSHYSDKEFRRIIENVSQQQVKIYATFVFNDNYEKLIKIIDLCIEFGIELKINFVSGFGSAKDNKLKICNGREKVDVLYNIAKLLLSRDGLIEVLASNFVLDFKFYYPCSAFGRALTVFPDGDMYPCHSLNYEKYHLGNLNKTSADEVISKYESLISDRVYKKTFDVFNNTNCDKCNYRSICGGYCVAKDEVENFSDCEMRKFWVDFNTMYFKENTSFRDDLNNFLNFYLQRYG